MLKDDLLPGVKAMAEYAGESERSMYHLIQTGRVPVIRKGRRIFARKSELDRAFSSAVA